MKYIGKGEYQEHGNDEATSGNALVMPRLNWSQDHANAGGGRVSSRRRPICQSVATVPTGGRWRPPPRVPRRFRRPELRGFGGDIESCQGRCRAWRRTVIV